MRPALSGSVASASPEPEEDLLKSAVYAPHLRYQEPADRGGRELTFAQALNEAMAQEMARDGSVFLMGEDVGATGGIFQVSKGLMDRFGPERVRDTPISEATFCGAGVGAAIAGMRPIVEVQIFDFVTLMMDMIVMALACDRTAVASLQWSDTEAKHTFPWLSLTQHHHYYQHDGGFKPVECEKICNWYSQMHLYLIQAMAAVQMTGGTTLLDESVVFFGNELSDPPNHRKQNMPFMLAGNGNDMLFGCLDELLARVGRGESRPVRLDARAMGKWAPEDDEPEQAAGAEDE